MFKSFFARMAASRGDQKIRQEVDDLKKIVDDRESAIRERETTVLQRERKIRDLERDLSEATDKLHNVKVSRPGLATSADNVAPINASNISPLASPLDAVTPTDALSEWKGYAAKISNLRGAQAPLVEPYVLEQPMNGVMSRFLIATREGQDWYDKFSYNETSNMEYLGIIGPGSVVLDCGANHGVNSLSYSAAVGPTGKVIGFDPFPSNIEICRINAKLNGRSNMEFVPVGLSDSQTDVVVSINEQCVELGDKTADDTITITLDLLDNYARYNPTLIKIDIEGAEINALAGATRLLGSRPSLYIEIHDTFLPRFGHKPMDMFNHVKFDDYDFFLNYPGLPPLAPYDGSFGIVLGCAIFCVPKGKGLGPKRFF